MIELDKNLVEMLKNSTPVSLLDAFACVQPIDPNLAARAFQNGNKSEKDLIDEGYSPISDLKLLWTKGKTNGS